MQEISIKVGNELFQFSTFDNWCDTAQKKFSVAGVRWQDTLCIDSMGRVCVKGEEFMRAQEQDTFPIRVFDKLCGKT